MYRGRCSSCRPAQSSLWLQRKWHRTEPHGVRRNKQHLSRIGPFFFFSFSLYKWLNLYPEYLKATFHFSSLWIVRCTYTYWGAWHWAVFYVRGEGRELFCREIHPNPTGFFLGGGSIRPPGDQSDWGLLSDSFYLKLDLRQTLKKKEKKKRRRERGRRKARKRKKKI